MLIMFHSFLKVMMLRQTEHKLIVIHDRGDQIPGDHACHCIFYPIRSDDTILRANGIICTDVADTSGRRTFTSLRELQSL